MRRRYGQILAQEERDIAEVMLERRTCSSPPTPDGRKEAQLESLLPRPNPPKQHLSQSPAPAKHSYSLMTTAKLGYDQRASALQLYTETCKAPSRVSSAMAKAKTESVGTVDQIGGALHVCSRRGSACAPLTGVCANVGMTQFER